jgi:hypothetical protein
LFALSQNAKHMLSQTKRHEWLNTQRNGNLQQSTRKERSNTLRIGN